MVIGKAMEVRCGFRAGPDGVVPVHLTCWWIVTLGTVEWCSPRSGPIRLPARAAAVESNEAEAHRRREIA